MPPVFALIVTGKQAFNDFVIFTKTLELWHSDAILHIFTDTPTISEFGKLRSKLTMYVANRLDKYAGLTRSDMEARVGAKYDSLFKDYTYEKADVMRAAFEDLAAVNGVWFNDSDIVHLAPLPLIPSGAKIALSPHYIRAADERLYGKYNAGFFWIGDPTLIDVWIGAASKSRFYEQAALEDVAAAAGTGLYEFPPNVNFGWWRMFQGADPAPHIQSQFSIHRGENGVGLRYARSPLQSIHTHIDDKTSSANGIFNKWFEAQTAKIATHPPMRALRRILNFK